MPQKHVAILIVVVYLVLAACVESKPSSPTLPKPTVYEWIGTGQASLAHLAQDKAACFQEAELTDPHPEPGIVSEDWKANVKRCMQKKGWGEKAVN
ncbi:MAG: hypothetical protein EHM80_04895 [Nitrospiraceae bacterium]|nr:MAG: hypothetical protein EHM80_04895 [Nitrospiraceae bacterium]